MEEQKNRIKVGISIGDVNGIGLEVILKTLEDERITKFCTPIIYGSSKVVSYHKNIAKVTGFSYHNIRHAKDAKEDKVNVLNCWNENVNIKLGQITESGGKYAYQSLERVTKDLKEGLIDTLVTAPISKESIQMSGFKHPGHTEYLAEKFGVSESLMLLVNGKFRVGLVTNHVPLRRVFELVKRERVLKKILLMEETLRIDFGIDIPKIAVLALNPHAGDGGLIGNEEIKQIIPAVEQAKAKNVMVMGPYSADGFFGSGQHLKFDGILAMYHDQGLIPFKALSFGSGVNYTGGLPIVRTSPDHGTAFDIVGTNMADPSSFRQSLFLAIDICKSRNAYMERHANPLRPGKAANKVNKVDEDISALPDNY